MDPQPLPDESPGDYWHDGRDETRTERADRNWIELLQEFRVLQTGTQILTGFLLAVVFQPRFQELDALQLTTYIVLVGLAAAATMVALTPVGIHRALFGRRRKPDLVRIAARAMTAALVILALLTVGVTALIVDVALGRTAGIVALVVASLVVVVLWAVLPFGVRHRYRDAARESPQVGRPSESPASD
ncbi:DUF6328 family protein [Microbacterium resistens]|uniref:DUF6328 family protein n=1 Tax=Microbacterium resistens TaxID=156977 RepID=UPI000834AECA|nr:DUF6328 family protein [Microbacterium resistens]